MASEYSHLSANRASHRENIFREVKAVEAPSAGSSQGLPGHTFVPRLSRRSAEGLVSQRLSLLDTTRSRLLLSGYFVAIWLLLLHFP